MWIEEKGRYIVLLPGPPRELQAIFEQNVLPKIRQLSGRNAAGIQILSRYRNNRVGTGFPDCSHLHNLSPGADHHSGRHAAYRDTAVSLDRRTKRSRRISKSLRQKFRRARRFDFHNQRTSPWRRSSAGSSGNPDKRLPLPNPARQECSACTSHACPEAPAISGAAFSATAMTPKMELCGVPPDLLQKHGAVSAEVAEALARGVRNALHSTIGLSITGIAGPGGGSPEKPVGLVYIGISDGNQSESRHRDHARRQGIHTGTIHVSRSFVAAKIPDAPRHPIIKS